MVAKVRQRADNKLRSAGAGTELSAQDAKIVIQDVRNYLDQHYIPDLTILLKELALQFGITLLEKGVSCGAGPGSVGPALQRSP
jgi:hypothetical protein